MLQTQPVSCVVREKTKKNKWPVFRDSSLQKSQRDISSSVPSHRGIRERTQLREQHCERALLAAAFANWNHADTTDASLRKVLRERRAALPPDHDFEAFRQQRITLDSALFACGVLLHVRLLKT